MLISNLQIDEKTTIIQEWSRNYSQIAQEQSRMMPDRMPSALACDDMIMDMRRVMDALNRLKTIIHAQENELSEQRMREHGGKRPGDYDEEMSMYGDDMRSQGYGGSDSKKRRGVCLSSLTPYSISNSD